MGRKAREKCGNSVYHISSRGNNKQDIFLDDEDRHEYLARLIRYRERYKMHIYAYCLMTNHIHLLIYDNDQDISRFMQGLNLSYAIYFNKKYQQSGHLFQERYYSVIVKSDAQLIYTSRYIHLNPVRAKIVERAEDYKWSSYSEYEADKDKNSIVNADFLLGLFCCNTKKARKKYREYINSQIEDSAEEEMAASEDRGKVLSGMMVGLPRVTEDEIYTTLEEIWNEKAQNIIFQDDFLSYERKLIIAYLLGLLARKSYRQVAQIMSLEANEIYKMIKQFVERMVTNDIFKHQIDQFINLNWKKSRVNV